MIALRSAIRTATALCALLAVNAFAQTWPAKPVRLIVTFPPGGSSDLVARLISGPLTEKLGQTVVIDNRPGGGATIGAAMVATAPADGYTLMLSNTTPISISPFMLDKPTYDGAGGFTHMFYIGSVPNIFVVHPSVPVKNMKELITFIRGQKDAVNYGSGGIGSIGHIIGELFKNDNKLKMEHVGYRGSAPMHTDLIGGQIPMAVDSFPQNVPYMQTGKLRGIAVTSLKRMALSPDVPTVVEVGMPKLVAENFLGVSGPPGTPAAVTERVHKEMSEIVKRPDMVKKFDELGISMRPMTPAEFTTFVKKQVADWGPAVKASGAKLN
ncbi:MAG: Bug family tripartite tricarboxylate transporter substrate binding protein [Burkholderiales bacterium]